ncbi:hypothetical protein M8A51_18695 [Schlegelella sp. S2-27]|uniref:HEAT repeat domain-containing protein n=1 Tax=Caldimonas mangrovi TaxID=2944811 RepID=A0ABT0YUQ8_9BURK|nr:hypothetical protein [Caldimonas mangrovi]MCM5681558.1 hypothetical protein [Caldimonas mangrovi]
MTSSTRSVEQVEEERQLPCVAVTQARQHLYPQSVSDRRVWALLTRFVPPVFEARQPMLRKGESEVPSTAGPLPVVREHAYSSPTRARHNVANNRFATEMAAPYGFATGDGCFNAGIQRFRAIWQVARCPCHSMRGLRRTKGEGMGWLSRWLKLGLETPVSWEAWLLEARSSSGYRREAAVRALALSGDDRALPVLLERANDWVPQVRQAATRAVGAYLREEHLSAWRAALPMVAALQRARRADHTELLSAILAFLAQPMCLAVLKTDLVSPHREVQRLLFQVELSAVRDDSSRYQLLRGAVLSADLVVARGALSAIEALTNPEQRLSLAGVACYSRVAAIRAGGLRAALAGGRASSCSLARKMCEDRSEQVRSAAVAALAPEDCAHVAQAARDRFEGTTNARDRAVALDVLCVLVPDDTARLCVRGRGDGAPLVRCIAYARSFASADSEERDRLVMFALEDASARVRRLAAIQVRRGASPPPREWLRALVQRNRVALPSVMSVGRRLSPWSRLALLLELSLSFADEDEGMRGVNEEIRRWSADMARCFLSPSVQELLIVQRAWTGARDGLKFDSQRDVAAHLRAFKVLGG